MPGTPPYIPKTNNGFDDWLTNFSALIVADPTRYGLLTADATAISAQQVTYNAAFQIAGTTGISPRVPINPATRTPVTVAAMNADKALALAVVRPYAIQIRNNQGVSNDDKIALGLTIVKTIPTPIPAPVSYPVIDNITTQAGQGTFRFRDSILTTTKQKPFGTINCQIYINMATPPANPAADPSLSDYVDVVTKSPFILSFAGADAGKTARLWGRWQTRKGLVGPFGPPVDFTVPRGGM